jgi:hypothetical protein
MRWTLALAALVLVSHAAPIQAAELDPRMTRLDPKVCVVRAVPIDVARERAEVDAATQHVEAEHRLQLDARDRRSSVPAEVAAAAIREVDHAYYRARFQALYPLAAHGNGHAVYELAMQRRWVDSGFTDEAEWLRLLKCASALGDPNAADELMIVYWHDKGDDSFAAIQKNRAVALDLVERGAESGDFGGLEGVGVYIGAGYHQYPVNPEIGQRTLRLCARLGDINCQHRFVEAVEQHRAYELRDPVDYYVLLETLAARQPALYATRRDVVRAKLSPAQIETAQARADEWRTTPWADLKDEWRAIRHDIETGACPASVTCHLAVLCTCPR